MEALGKKEEQNLHKLAKNEQVALTDRAIEKKCKAADIKCNFINLDKLPELKYDQAFCYTGDKPNEVNSGNPHHWLYVIGNHIFDSYGKDENNEYKLPEGFKIFKQKPNRLQEYNSDVCGEYCTLFAKFVQDLENGSDIDTDSDDDEATDNKEAKLAQKFINEFGFTSDQRKNDEIALLEFENL